ncbi:MAG: septum formation protein [Bacteroidia bacterium]|jgi:septum formation protein
MTEKMNILLGSNSPRRNELLAQLGFDFTKVSITCDEDFSPDMAVGEVAEYLAIKKSVAYKPLHDSDILITADTVVIAEGIILNKPADRTEAIHMLSTLSGKEHSVQTGVCIRSVDKQESFTSETVVKLRKISQDDIAHYVDTYKPYDKAGAYGIQEWFGLALVESISGSFYNVVGLPTDQLYKRLKNNYNA